MKIVSVWDTYVTKDDGQIMHFDVVVPSEVNDPQTVFKFGKEYLTSKGLGHLSLTSKECTYCHMEVLQSQNEAELAQKGYFIIEMEGC